MHDNHSKVEVLAEAVGEFAIEAVRRLSPAAQQNLARALAAGAKLNFAGTLEPFSMTLVLERDGHSIEIGTLVASTAPSSLN